jgi:hypothetical protein
VLKRGAAPFRGVRPAECSGYVSGRNDDVPAHARRTNVGVTEIGDHLWLVTFMHYDLGYFADETGRLEPIENPFGSKVLPMSPE